MPKVVGVYVIENIVTKDEYVGSSLDVIDRIRHHFRRLQKGEHHSPILQRAFNKYGNKFRWYLVEAIDDISILRKREQWWIDVIDPKYNILKTTSETKKPNDRHLSDEHKKKLKLAWTDERRKKWSEIKRLSLSPAKGKIRSKSFGDKVSSGHRKNDAPIILLSSTGEIYKFLNICRFCKEHNLRRHSIRSLLSRGWCSSLPDWKVINYGWAEGSNYGLRNIANVPSH